MPRKKTENQPIPEETALAVLTEEDAAGILEAATETEAIMQEQAISEADMASPSESLEDSGEAADAAPITPEDAAAAPEDSMEFPLQPGELPVPQEMDDRMDTSGSAVEEEPLEADEAVPDPDATPPDEPQEPVLEEAETEAVSADAAPAKKPRRTRKKKDESAPEDSPAPQPARRSRPSSSRQDPVLTIEARDEVESPEDQEDTIWHEIQNAYLTHKILTGQLGGIESTEAGSMIAVLDYKGFRVVIPAKEMILQQIVEDAQHSYGDRMQRQGKLMGSMLGAEIDFMVRGIDAQSRSVVASRRAAAMRKRQTFYLDKDVNGEFRVREGRIVQARVIAVADKVIRVEILGVECSILARDISYGWMGDAHEQYHVGDRILVKVLAVSRGSAPEEVRVKADIKSVTRDGSRENLKKCRVQGKYAGKVTDVYKGRVYVRLSIGVNAIAHSCYDNRMPAKKDDVSFAVTRIDEENGVAVGIITRVIRQNV